MILGGHFDLEQKKVQIKKFENQMKEDNFWDDIETANQVNKEMSYLKKITEEIEKTKISIVDNLELINICEESDLKIIEKDIEELKNNIEQLEINTLLNGKFDNLNCYLEIQDRKSVV